jgi:arylsulfatase A-like enzyme
LHRSRLHPFFVLLSTTLFAAAVFHGCSSDSDERPDRIVLVTIDTLRADHVGAYGYPLDVTPFIDSLAETGVGFGRALAHASATAPSHASIFTGLYPIQHGVNANGLKLPDELGTLAEAFSEEGYKTAAFVSTNAHFRWGGLDQGFDVYDEQPLNGEESTGKNKKTGRAKVGKYRPADQTIDAALEWLSGVEPRQKIFLWIHVYDPHKKLRPPHRYRDQVTRLVEELGADRYRQALQDAHGDLDYRHLYRDILLYDAEILFVDSQLERFYRAMESPRSDDLWIVTSDHGQGMYSHDSWFGHVKQVYNTQILVPLIFHYTARPSEPTWIADSLVQHVDLLPTLAEIVGLDFSQPGLLPQGRSLVPFLNGSRPEQTAPYSFAQSSRDLGKHMRRPERSWPKYSLQSLEFKYILNERMDDEFYDLRADPFERHNKLDAAELADDEARVLGTLVRMMETLTNTEVEAEMVDDATIERLKALGYLQ